MRDLSGGLRAARAGGRVHRPEHYCDVHYCYCCCYSCFGCRAACTIVGLVVAFLTVAKPECIQKAQDAMRCGYSQRPDVRALVEAILECTTDRSSCVAGSSGDGGVSSLGSLSQRLQTVCTLRAGVPSQPMLAKPCTSIADAIRMLRSGVSAPSQAVCVAAEYKYDGQRAQIHRTAEGAERIFSRKLDDMTSKYPGRDCQRHSRARAPAARSSSMPRSCPSRTPRRAQQQTRCTVGVVGGG